MPKFVKKIGVDIGSYSVKLIELHNSKEETRLAAFSMKRVEANSAEALARLIKSMCDEAGTSTKYASVAISGPQVITRFVTMPSMSDSEMKNALVFEVEKNIPFNPEEVIYDYQILERGKEKTTDVLLTAVKRDYIEKYLTIAQSCGLTLEAIDVDSFALVNAFLKSTGGSLDAAKTFALINIGEKNTNLSILRGQTISFCRDIQISGHDFNEAIARLLNVDPKAAEKLKHQPQGHEEELGVPLRTVLGNLADEIRLSFGYFENKYGRGVDEIYISGGSAKVLGLKECIEENFGVKANMWDPLKTFIVDKNKINEGLLEEAKQSLAISAGLAMR